MKNSFWGLVPALLLVAFIVLKLCKVISWSWWWITAPVWIPLVILVALAVYVVYTLRNEKIDLPEGYP